MFGKILIANRGEIACRVIKTARRLGVRAVGVYSDADRGARHVRMADETVLIGPAPASESYLRIDRLIAAAQQTGAEAIHPGYGFLSENPGLAEECTRAGLVFIGPPASAIRAMGSKSAAKALMAQAGVPVLPGYHGDNQDPEMLASEAGKIGYPVLIKAALGGGGKGMRIVENAAGFAAALAACQREAQASFADARVLLEKYLVPSRHIEMQIFADGHGNCLHLFERDCSVQRRHQKILEEAPAPGMTSSRRRKLGQAAVTAAKAVGYIGAGTVEFIVDQDGGFYFMEMNTRLQVEHPVTEMITGLDLVEWQLRVAAGEPLPNSQEEVTLSGAAIEARIYAEDPEKNFLPSSGKIVHLSFPVESAHVRVDSGFEAGDHVSPHYDPLLAKLIVWGKTRAAALRYLKESLGLTRIVGVRTNLEFLKQIASSPSFSKAKLDTNLVEREWNVLDLASGPPPSAAIFAAAVASLLNERRLTQSFPAPNEDLHSPWFLLNGWRLNARLGRTLSFSYRGSVHVVTASADGAGFSLQFADVTVAARGKWSDSDLVDIEADGWGFGAKVVIDGLKRHVFVDGTYHELVLVDPLDFAADGPAAETEAVAPIPGHVVALLTSPGATVKKGDALLVLEAMKMELTISAPMSGKIRGFPFAVGDHVPEGARLVEFELKAPTTDAGSKAGPSVPADT